MLTVLAWLAVVGAVAIIGAALLVYLSGERWDHDTSRHARWEE